MKSQSPEYYSNLLKEAGAQPDDSSGRSKAYTAFVELGLQGTVEKGYVTEEGVRAFSRGDVPLETILTKAPTEDSSVAPSEQ